MVITDEDNNEYANEQIGDLITRESFACQKAIIGLQVSVKAPFRLLSRNMQSNNLLLILNLKNILKVGVGRGARGIRGGGGDCPLPPFGCGPEE